MDLVQRYIAAVQRQLPESKQQEIGRELQANIMDQLDALAEQKGELADTDIVAVLKHMGHPRVVARQFVPPQPLIRLSYMPLYQNTLFMVLGILFLLQVVQTTVSWLSSADMGLVRYLFSLASGFLDDAIFGFACITLGFWAMSRQPPTQSDACETDWQPEHLPKAGPGWQHISVQDIFTDLATYTFLLVVIWYPVWMSADQAESSGFVLSDQTHLLLKWFSPLAVLGIVVSLWQLRQRLWSHRMLMGNIALNLALVAATLTLAASGPLLSADIDQWQGVFELVDLERSAMLTLIIIAMFPLWEAGRDLLRLRKM